MLNKFEQVAIEEAQEILDKSVKGASFVNVNVRLLEMLISLAKKEQEVKVIQNREFVADTPIGVSATNQPPVITPLWPRHPSFTDYTYPLDKTKIVD